MRPLELELAGFASFREPQTVDFTEMDDLFVITGPTGSGKTTLLDAITMALFAEVPRANQHERKEFIAIGADRLKVRFDFLADGDHYRVTRVFPRTGSQDAAFERVGADGEARPVLGDALISDIDEAIVERIGLDVDAFTKAVLLPQGEFHKFLKGKSAERKETGIRLLDLERFRQAGRIARARKSSLAEKAETRRELIEREFADATDERLETLIEAHAEATARHDALTELVEGVEDELEALEALGRRLETLDRIGAGFDSVAEALEAAAERQAELAPRTEATARALEKADERLGAAKAAHQERVEALDRVRTERATEEELARLEAAHEKRSGAARERSELAGPLEEARRTAEALDEQRARVAEALDEAEQAKQAAAEGLEEAREAVREAEERLGQARQRETAEQARTEARAAKAAAVEQAGEAEQALEKAEAALAEARARYTEVHRTQHVAALRREVAPGEACPVCERTMETVPDVPPEGEAALERAAGAVEAAEQRVGEAREAREEAREAVTRTSTRLEQAEAALEGLGALSVEAAEAAHETAVETREAAAETHEAATERHRKASERAAELAGDRKAVAERIEGLGERLEAAAEREEAAAEAIGAFFGAGERPDDLPAWIADAREALEAARAARGEADKALEEARTSREEAAKAVRDHERALGELDTTLTTIRARLDGARETLVRLPDLAAADPPAALDDEAASRTERLEALVTWRSALAEAASDHASALREARAERLDGVRAAAADAGLEPDEPTATSIRAALRSGLEAATERHVELRAALEATREAIGKREAHEAEIGELEATARRYGQLATELRTDRFLQFLLEESFEELAVRASQELRSITDGRYSLVADGYDFRITDHGNADEERSVVTLSGGETFLASLSLALALAGGIRDIAGTATGSKLEAIFIDEGFGTLDPEALDTVIDALEQIQQGDRMVGVITHVQALAERIPGGLVVEPGGAGGTSTVRAR